MAIALVAKIVKNADTHPEIRLSGEEKLCENGRLGKKKQLVRNRQVFLRFYKNRMFKDGVRTEDDIP